MTDRLILFLIVISPFTVMIGMWLVRRWYTLPGNQVAREAMMALVALLGPLAYLAYTDKGDGGQVTRVHLERPEWLLLVIPMFAFVLFLQQKTLSGISRGRMWSAFLLRTSIMILLIGAVAG